MDLMIFVRFFLSKRIIFLMLFNQIFGTTLKKSCSLGCKRCVGRGTTKQFYKENMILLAMYHSIFFLYNFKLNLLL